MLPIAGPRADTRWPPDTALEVIMVAMRRSLGLQITVGISQRVSPFPQLTAE